MPPKATITNHFREPNRRLAVFALLRVDDAAAGRRHRFAKDADPANGVAKLGAQSLFDVLRPELRFVSDPTNPKTTVTISDLTFLSYSALTPADALATGQPTKSMQILRRSHLLEKLDHLLPKPTAAGLDGHEVVQQIGADLFKELVVQLDAVVGFDHPRFTAGLTRVLQVYVPKVNEKLEDAEQIDASALQRWLVRDVVLRGQLVKFLMGLEDDDPATRAELSATLGAIAQGTEDSPFHTQEDAWARQIDAVLDALADLKSGMLNDADATRAYLVQQAGPWVADVTKNGEYNFPFPKTGKGGDFLALYRAAKAANDWVSRFVRTEAMHSFLVCWLASKYQAHKLNGVGQAANEMFRVGVQEVRGRVLGQSRRDVGTYMTLIDARTNEAADRAKAEAQVHLGVVKERIKSYFLPVSAYTRDRQLARAARLFVTACQLAGGAIAELHDANKIHSDAVNVLQQHVLKFCADARKAAKAASEQETKVSLGTLKAFLKGKAPDHAAFVDTAFAALPEETTAWAVKEAYVNGFASDVLAQFSTGFDAGYDLILKEKAELERLFGLWCGVALEGKGETAGLTNAVTGHTTSSEAAAVVPAEERKTLPARQAEALKARATAGKSQVASAVPQPVAERLKGRAGAVPARLLNGDQVVGRGTVAGDTLTIDRAADTPAAKPSELDDTSGLKLEFTPDPAAADQTPIDFALTDLKDVSVNELFPRATPGGRDAVAAADDYDKLSQRVKGCHEKYLGGRADDAAFRRTMRAAKLAQSILAAPRGKVNLDARDLSNSLGVMQEMVEKYGDQAAPMFANKPDAETTPEGQRLKEVNLSEFYPLADADWADMGKILAYHYKLCGNLMAVTGYLQELRELRDFFDAVAQSDLEIEVVNRTVGDYAAGALRQRDDLFFKRPPLGVYLTHQARPTAENALAGLGTFLGRLAGNPLTPHFQYPFVVLPPNAGAAPAGLKYPVFAADDAKLPNLDDVLAKPIQNPPHLLWVAALLAAGGCRFGGPLPAGGDAPLTLSEDLAAAGLPDWNTSTHSVHHYLRNLWANTTAKTATYGDQVLLLKWTNAALLMAGEAADAAAAKVPPVVLPRSPFGNWPVWARDVLVQVYGPPTAAGGGAAGAAPAPAPVLYPALFDGLPIGSTPVEVEVRFDAGGAANALNSIVGTRANAELLVGGRPIAAPWAPN